MSPRGRLLIAAAFLFGVFIAADVRESLAGAPASGPTCCVCQCQGQPTACFAAGSDDGCGPFLNQCGGDTNATCRAGFIPGNCTDVGCASIGVPAAAPALDVTGLAAGVVVLSALAALRLRRLARQRSRSR